MLFEEIQDDNQGVLLGYLNIKILSILNHHVTVVASQISAQSVLAIQQRSQNAHQRETSGSSDDSLHLHSFSNGNFYWRKEL